MYWRPDVAAASVFAAAFLRLTLKDVRLPSWAPPAVFIVALSLLLASRQPWITLTTNGLLLAFVGATAERSATTACRILETRPMVFLGTISYSLYIWQQLFKYAYEGGLPRFVAVLVSLGIAVFSYYRVERPGKEAILAAWRRHGARNRSEMTSQH